MPTLGVPIAILAVVVSVALSVPANFATKVIQDRWIQRRKEREEQIRWLEELLAIVRRISGSTEIFKRSLVSHDTLIPDDDFIEKQLEVSFAKERSNWENKLDDEILDELEDRITSEEAVAHERADHQRSAFETIEKINQRKMSEMASLHDELLRHVARHSFDEGDSIQEPLEDLLTHTYTQSLFREITDSGFEEIQDSCDQLIDACETRIGDLS